MENYPFYPFLSGALGKWGTRKTIFLLINTLGTLQFGTQYQEVKPWIGSCQPPVDDCYVLETIVTRIETTNLGNK